MDTIWEILPAPMQDKLQGYVEGFWTILPNVFLAILFLILVWIIARLV